MPKDFSGCLPQSSPVVIAVQPLSWWINCRFHGSHTQKQSMVPTFMLATICGGGTTMVSMSLSGSMQPAAGLERIQRSWVPPGNVIAALIDLPLAFFLSSATLNGAVSTPTLMSLYSFATEMHWPLRLSRAKMYIGVG